MYKKYHQELNDEEKILLSRLYKLDRKINAFMIHHKNESMNKIIPQTDFIKKTHELYSMMSYKLIKISLERTKFTQNLVDIKRYIDDNKK